MCQRVLILQRLTNYDQKRRYFQCGEQKTSCSLRYSGKIVSMFAPMAALPYRKVKRDLQLLCFKKIQMC